MNLPFFIARRYLLAKKSHNLINIVTWISIISVCVASFAMIVVLSVFNGFAEVLSALNHQLTPDYLITPKEGKTFVVDSVMLEKLHSLDGVDAVFPTLSEDALFKNGERQQLGTLKGVPDNYVDINRIKNTNITDRMMRLHSGETPFAIPGIGVAYSLGINFYSTFCSIQVFVPQRGKASSFSLDNAFNTGQLNVETTFEIQQEADERLVFAPYRWTAELLDLKGKASSLEVFTAEGANLTKMRREILDIVGDKFEVKDEFEQQETLYKMIQSEKFAVYLILVFVLILAIFNVIGSLTMLIIEKRKDVDILRSLGADKTFLGKVFIHEGLLIAVAGGLLGLVLGVITVVLQKNFGFISLGNGGNYLIDAYPVALALSDIILVFCTITFIGGLTAYLIVKKSLKNK